ncbi:MULTISPECIES: hypothetical protein [Proteus]|uniref:hypothetical protein n=1 Tax=Proteus TaxID=583 RepID=UPI0012BA99C7|nr:MULTISPECIES: hypothetical protein [Proteus]EHT2444566.1 hypothetical protein [Proteus mirabilis]EHZ8013557.1 hypothetical protein [Proteus mirabilis]EKT8676611.1 hypothetical protein [Proteus mirabilis]EKU0463641.1 hypothetical protein [Proteus mirabilis]EKU3803131.1 hypothetical protein [Proteus mirabilis]
MTFVDDVSPSSRPFFYLQLTLLIMTENNKTVVFVVFDSHYVLSVENKTGHS